MKILKINYGTFPINRIKIDHQFCLFHTKQKIYRDINEYIDENNSSEIELKIINHYKLMIYELIDAEDLETSNSIKNELTVVKNYLNVFMIF